CCQAGRVPGRSLSTPRACGLDYPGRVDPPWASLRDEELLALRIRDVHVPVEESPLAPRVAALYGELEARGLSLRPPCYLGDEWFSPEGDPAIAIPFYLAHPRLALLELHQMMGL